MLRHPMLCSTASSTSSRICWPRRLARAMRRGRSCTISHHRLGERPPTPGARGAPRHAPRRAP
eukprot:2045267-Pyramimonas_sp.AAC.1